MLGLGVPQGCGLRSCRLMRRAQYRQSLIEHEQQQRGGEQSRTDDLQAKTTREHPYHAWQQRLAQHCRGNLKPDTIGCMRRAKSFWGSGDERRKDGGQCEADHG
jgi:hypothetical protein